MLGPNPRPDNVIWWAWLIDAQFAAPYADFAVCGPRFVCFASVLGAAESKITITGFACLLDTATVHAISGVFQMWVTPLFLNWLVIFDHSFYLKYLFKYINL
jgi:hypothetical protein